MIALNTETLLPRTRRFGWVACGLFAVLVSLLLPVSANAQSRSQLRNLFFDAVYPDESSRVLLSSGNRSGGEPGISMPLTQPARTPSEILTDIQSYQESINSLVESSGIYEPVLAQEYLAMGHLYEQLGDRENAILAFENAMHISRVNQGLFTLAQVDAVRSLIAYSKNVRNYAEADKYHEYLYYLLSQNLEPGSKELTEASLEWAEWNMEAYRRQAFLEEDDLSVSGDVTSAGAMMLRRGELVAVEDDQFSEILFVPRTSLINNPAALRMQSFSPEQLIDPRLRKAEDIFDEMLGNDEANSEVIRRKANIMFLFKKQLEQFISFNAIGSNINTSQSRAVRSVGMLRRGYGDIRDSLVDAATSLQADDPVGAARIYLDIGDWDLAFDRPGRAEESYNLARDLLLAQGMSEEEITHFVTPEPALLIPEYATYEYTRGFLNIPEDSDVPYSGYIDVIFEKRPNGTVRGVDIENASDDTGQLVRDRLLDMLRGARMRPLFVAGETVPQSDIKVRYYYSY